MKTGFLQEKGEARYSRVLEVPATRGRIVDRNGEALAISTPVKSVWAIPEDVKATPGAAEERSAALLQLDARETRAQALRRGARVRLPEAPDPARDRGARRRARHPRHPPAERVPPLLPGRRDDGARGRLHRRGRRRPGRHRARAAGGARRRRRQPPRDQGPARPHRRGRRVDPRRAGRARPHARARQQDPEPRLRRAQGGGRGAQGQGGRDRGARRAHRRGARARQPAHLQPEQPRAADRRAAAQPRDDRQLRAGLDAEALHRRPGDGDGPDHAADDDPDRARHADHRQLHDPRRASPAAR